MRRGIQEDYSWSLIAGDYFLKAVNDSRKIKGIITGVEGGDIGS